MEISWQYLAGFLDGEGSIGTTHSGKSRLVTGRVTIANTNHELLHLLKAQFGGSVSVRKAGSKPGWRPFGSVTWTGRKAQYILERVLPYLILKREQAELCLQLIRMRDQPKSVRFDWVHRPLPKMPSRHFCIVKPEVVAQEMALAARMKELNRKGTL